MENQEKSASDRKKDHIELTTRSQMSEWSNDKRFYYEPILSPHPEKKDYAIDFLAKKMRFPLWVSSMTGGTEQARKINENLAAACKEFGLGMGLGSCRILLEEPEKHLSDFAIRHKMGPNQPLYANLGIAQLEKNVEQDEWGSVKRMLEMLEADGLIIHVNPLQEWLQPEGDKITASPLETIKATIEKVNAPIIVKEVGQGMGPKSLKALMELPVVIEFGAYGGTNFSQMEIQRSEDPEGKIHGEVSRLGHNAAEMIDFVNEIVANGQPSSKGFIVSGGIKTYLDGYHAVNKLNAPGVYGQASTLLKKAMISEKALFEFIEQQMEGYNLAGQYLTIRD